MGRRGNASTLILIMLLLITLTLAGGVFYLFQKEHERNLALQGELENTIQRYKVAESGLSDAKSRITAMDLQLKEAQGRVDMLAKEIEDERAAKQEALTNLDQIKQDLEQQKGAGADLEQKLNQAQENLKKMQDQLKDLGSQKSKLEAKIKDIEAKPQNTGVELGKIVVTPEGTQVIAKDQPAQAESAKKAKGTLLPSREGKVLVINKDYDFVVINLGSKDGVEIEDIFSVYHENKIIGEVQVEKVHDSMSAAGFLSGDIKSKAKEEDKVVQKVK